ncbi:type I secretion outer membrane protein, TolC family [Methylocaldum marinum]|uniref:Type I secretion outer membrane protein, TolC family n=1 Tax=Methylocaldum marinum TaxID=1432792 RepID=A0A250KRD3_9GAMM|nr:TolC family outer membrane protein [Methylocaldum marinum]BBA34106.1 type I secretion outer membrane protein, TolC family [Methylocaldum marinum]
MKKSILLGLLLLAATDASAQDLLQTLELALQHDPRLRQAEATRNATLEARPQSVARLLPSLSLTGELNRNSVLSKFEESVLAFIAGGRNIGFWDSSASINLTQPIYHHDYWVQLSQADNQIAEAEANYAAEQQDLMLRASRAYFEVLFARDSRDFALAEQRAIERQLEQAKARFEVGLIAITDVHEAQAGYDQARANLIQAENQVDNAREALQEIIGEYDVDLAALIEEIPLKGPEPENIENWSDLAQQSNLNIVAAENRSQVAKKDIDLQFAGHLPTLDLVGSAGFTDTNRTRGIPTEYQVIGMRVNVPMFAGGGVNSRVRQARYQYEAAQENLDGVRRSVKRQVKDAYRGILSAISQVQALEAAVVSAQSAVEASEAGLEVGTRTMVDVLTEQRNLFRTKRDYARARYDYIINSLSLKQAAGTLNPADLAIVNQWLRPNSKADTALPYEPGA